MNWLKKCLYNWVNSDEYEALHPVRSKRTGFAMPSDDETLSSDPLVLRVYRANGGTIVETKQYDRHKDRSQSQLHIVGNDADLGESLAKIITLESLRG